MHATPSLLLMLQTEQRREWLLQHPEVEEAATAEEGVEMRSRSLAAKQVDDMLLSDNFDPTAVPRWVHAVPCEMQGPVNSDSPLGRGKGCSGVRYVPVPLQCNAAWARGGCPWREMMSSQRWRMRPPHSGDPGKRGPGS